MRSKTMDEEVESLHYSERSKMLDERDFWGTCVQYAIEPGMTEIEVYTAIKHADIMLEAMRQRFPL